jgi:uncharacterized protein with GYD domain
MATYITLGKWTPQGMAKIKEGPARLDAVKRAMKAAGAEMKGFYQTLGRYDFVSIVDAPDDATVSRVLLATGSQGNVRTETLRAFTEEEYRKIVTSLP